MENTESVFKVSLDLEAIFKQTPSFPLYGGIKWKTRSLSLKSFFRFDGDFKQTPSLLLNFMGAQNI